MQYKTLSTYRITRKDNSITTVNAATMKSALDSLVVPDEEVPITSAVMTQESIKTLVEDLPTEVDLNVYTDPESGAVRCYATPTNAILHVGDNVTLEAFPARGYQFLGWKMDGEIISTDRRWVFKVPEIKNPQHYNRINVLAEFKEADIEWYCKVLPVEADLAGCIAGASKGIAEANAPIELIACPEGNYKFDGWFRNEVELGKEKRLNTNVTPLALNEEDAIYEARFSLKE